MQVIGVTGASGAGKSTISREICKIKNAMYINADKIAKDMSKKGEEYYQKIVEVFGENILNDDLEINRKKLAEIIFQDKESKRKLDNLTKIYVVPEIINEARKNEISVIDVPLLFESELDKICDIIIGVIAKKNACVNRIMKRDNIDVKLAKSRIESQNKEEFLKEKCDYCICNDEGADITKQIIEIFNEEINLMKT